MLTNAELLKLSRILSEWHPGVDDTGVSSGPPTKVTLSDDTNMQKLGTLHPGKVSALWCKVSGNPPDASCYAHYCCAPLGGSAPTAAVGLNHPAISDGDTVYLLSPVAVDVYAVRENGKAGITVGLSHGQVKGA